MTEEEQEEFLRNHGWRKIDQRLWMHKDCHYNCCLEVAIEIQNSRNQKKEFKSMNFFGQLVLFFLLGFMLWGQIVQNQDIQKINAKIKHMECKR